MDISMIHRNNAEWLNSLLLNADLLCFLVSPHKSTLKKRQILTSSTYSSTYLSVCLSIYYLLNVLPYEAGLDFASQLWCQPQWLPAQRPFEPHMEAGVVLRRFWGWCLRQRRQGITEPRRPCYCLSTGAHLNCALLLRVQYCKQLSLLGWRKTQFSSQRK